MSNDGSQSAHCWSERPIETTLPAAIQNGR